MTYFRSRRSAVLARNGAVATSQPLAAQAGLQMLHAGGNAVDAAVAAAAALGVVEPMSTGVGGDLFALIWDAKAQKVIALNGSGRSSRAADPAEVRRRGFRHIPTHGRGAALAVSVPGTVDGWQTALASYGQMTLREVLAPAIDYALHGYAVSEVIADSWQESEAKLSAHPSGLELLPGGRAPRHGEVVRLPELGRTLQTIAEGGHDAFYRGDLARRIAAFVQAEGGWLTADDLAAHHSDWDEPIHTDYRGVTVWECPPNGQGIAALMALNIAEGFDLPSLGRQSADVYHYLIESMRLAFADALRYVADPRAVDVPIDALLSKDYAARRRAAICPDAALRDVSYGEPSDHADTVYVTAADREGNACSLINSVFHAFGSGLVVPGTGIALQNRGALFSLDASHPNVLRGGQRPYQTIIPGLATRGGELWLSFGVMGGFQQPQGHLQVISNMVDFGLDPQAALDALRFHVDVEGGGGVKLETGVGRKTIAELRRRGHRIETVDGYARTLFGGGQVIARDPDTGVLVAGSEPRKDGAAVGW
jgi:gamma-glutamyltranspeptidase/glutathione hydrolase